VLKNPCQKRFFKAKDMRDLFTLQDEGESTETSNIFAQLSEEINVRAETDTGAQKNGSGKENVTEEENERVEGDGNILQSLMDAHGIHVSFLFEICLKLIYQHKVASIRFYLN
jgi:DNA excision repair protein ERCC-6